MGTIFFPLVFLLIIYFFPGKVNAGAEKSGNRRERANFLKEV